MSMLRMSRLVSLVMCIAACAPIDLGNDFSSHQTVDSSAPDSGSNDVGNDTTQDTNPGDTMVADTGAIDPLDPNYFFCFVQAQVYRDHGCASAGNNCHANESSLRLDPMPEITPPLACSNGVPTEPVPAAYYTNLARSRGEVRSTARRSELYLRPLGSDHPVDLFTASSPEAQILRNWIEGTR